ncbi:MAG: Rne/Rng family ribonuclease, partial [Magnetospiraceae bacterium]
KRRQVLLIQVVKEERGNKGAALTTYLSLAGRYCVLMPNTPRGGGVSRKISNAKDRRRLRTILDELSIPEGMAVIVRTAGAERSKAEIRRDYEYLLRAWSTVRETTLSSTAPCLVHEEGNLIKRSIRDLYGKDIEEVVVEGDNGYRIAKDFMRMLVPSHAKKVKAYKDEAMPLLHRFHVEGQLDAMHSPTIQLRSGGYIVINPTEALVAIDVNSGRATRERNIEETALKTNVEAAEEIARQLRLRDLAGLVVIDFIDMEGSRNQHAVERKLKESMRSDRARIQIGRISPFGLLEMSRQRLRPSLLETSSEPCPSCHGTGVRRSVESTVLHVLRAIEEEGIRRRTAELRVSVPVEVAFYLLNQKRDTIIDIEKRYDFTVEIAGDDTLTAPEYNLERLVVRQVEGDADPVGMPEEDTENEDGGRKRKRRRRSRKRRSDNQAEIENQEAADTVDADDGGADAEETEDAENDSVEEVAADNGEQPRKRRRRGRRGGRRRRRPEDAEGTAESADSDTETESNVEAVGDAANGDEIAVAPQAEGDEEAEIPAEIAAAENVSEEAPVELPLSEAADVQTEAEEEVETPSTEAPAETAAETAPAEEAKPKRRTRSRAKKAQTEETTAASDTDTEAEPVKKPRRRRRSPAAKANAETAADTAETEAPQEAAQASDVTVIPIQVPGAEPQPESVATEDETDAQNAPEVSESEPEAPEAVAPEAETAVEETPQTAPEPEPEQAAEPETPSPEGVVVTHGDGRVEVVEPTEKKRGGWWQRLTGSD